MSPISSSLFLRNFFNAQSFSFKMLLLARRYRPFWVHTQAPSFEHSLRVFFLARNVGDNVEKQVFALVHDFSHITLLVV